MKCLLNLSRTAKLIILVVIIGIIVGVVITLAATFTLHQTSKTSFCVSCHTMQQAYAEYQQSVHFKNDKGIRAECSDCHVPQSTLGLLKAKIGALSDIKGEIFGTIDTPELYEARREEMAKTAWAQLKANSSETCKSCHGLDAMDLAKQSEKAQKGHASAMKNNLSCIDCHIGVAHHLPKKKVDATAAAAATTPTTQVDVNNLSEKTVIYPVDGVDFYANNQFTVACGTIMPSAPLTVLEDKNGQLHVQLDGWKHDNGHQDAKAIPTVWFDAHKDIVSAQVTSKLPACKDFQKLLSDAKAGQAVSLSVWVKAPNVVENLAELWKKAEAIGANNCADCHDVYKPADSTANEWVGTIKDMSEQASLDEKDTQLLLQYMQKNASDMVKQTATNTK